MVAVERVAAGRPGRGVGQLADDAGLDQGADHDEQTGEEQQRLPLHAGHEVAAACCGTAAPAPRLRAGPPPTARCGRRRVPDEAGEHRGQHDAADDQQPAVLDRLALVQGHDVGHPLRIDSERAAEQQRDAWRRRRASASAAIGAMLIRKSLNVSPERLAMMMFGGSPIRVAAPPMLEASTSAIRNGTGSHVEPVADQQSDRGDQQHRGDVVQEGRGDGGDQTPARSSPAAASPSPASPPRWRRTRTRRCAAARRR